VGINKLGDFKISLAVCQVFGFDSKRTSNTSCPVFLRFAFFFDFCLSGPLDYNRPRVVLMGFRIISQLQISSLSYLSYTEPTGASGMI
jgi:hypothetical protein